MNRHKVSKVIWNKSTNLPTTKGLEASPRILKCWKKKNQTNKLWVNMNIQSQLAITWIISIWWDIQSPNAPLKSLAVPVLLCFRFSLNVWSHLINSSSFSALTYISSFSNCCDFVDKFLWLRSKWFSHNFKFLILF